MYVLSNWVSADGHLIHQEEMPITQYLLETRLLTLQSLTVRPFLRGYAHEFAIVDDLREKVHLCDPVALTVRDQFADIYCRDGAIPEGTCTTRRSTKERTNTSGTQIKR